MIKVGLIDDRVKERQAIRERLELAFTKLKIDWTVKDYDPFMEIAPYQKWLKDEKIDVLIVDERLNEQGSIGTSKVPYSGHELIEFIRSFDKSLPIFVITSHSDTADLLNASGSIDNIINRTAFAKYADQYVQTIIRVSNKYMETYEREFTRLSEISAKIASGEATASEIDLAKALQVKLYLPNSITSLVEREKAIENFNVQVVELDTVRKKIEDFLNRN